MAQINDSGKRETAYGQPRDRLLAWGKESNAHGTMYHDPIWLPEGDKPEVDEWIRMPWLDEPVDFGNRDEVEAHYESEKAAGRT